MKVTATVQVPAAATGFEVKQVVPELAIAKSPDAAMLVKVKGIVPRLVTVSVWAELVAPTFCVLNVRLVGEKDTNVASMAVVPERLELLLLSPG